MFLIFNFKYFFALFFANNTKILIKFHIKLKVFFDLISILFFFVNFKKIILLYILNLNLFDKDLIVEKDKVFLRKIISKYIDSLKKICTRFIVLPTEQPKIKQIEAW